MVAKYRDWPMVVLAFDWEKPDEDKQEGLEWMMQNYLVGFFGFHFSFVFLLHYY